MAEAPATSVYECIGICELEPASGTCSGCGRPWFDETVPLTVSATVSAAPQPAEDGSKVATSSAQ